MLKEIKPLHDKGFAIHLLKPKSKAPIEPKWTTGERKEWAAIEKQYRPGMNVGVRLGKASEIGFDEYLAVIDCDVKSTEARHAREMEEKLLQLFGKEYKKLAVAPTVLSGRGNGSKHVYISTGVPLQPRRLAQSSETVKVKMPSAGKPSRKEIDTLSQEEIDSGIRLRPAWEISLMGEGQQVVLPPSIHPDSGKAYKWLKSGEPPFLALTSIWKEKNDSSPVSGGQAARQTLDDWKPVAVDLHKSELSNRVIDMIVDGKDVEDRSGALFAAALAMVRCQFTDSQILSVLTDPDFYLGEAGYDHAKTNSRKRAAEWVKKYTLDKARLEADARFQFDSEVEVTDLPEEELLAIHAAATKREDWKEELDRTSPQSGSKPKVTFRNIVLILTNAVAVDVFKYNEFSGAMIYGVDSVPWTERENLFGKAVRDADLLQLKSWLAFHYRIEPTVSLIAEAATTLAVKNRYHPVREYLLSLKWDGKPRISTWLKDHMGAKAPEPYLSAVSRKVLVAMVARVFEPGCKFDQVLILEGGQGRGKSTAVRHLAGEKWFSDAHINIKDKDAVLSLQAHWIIELGELSGMRKADVDSLKEFISRTTDKIRVPYGRLPEDFPRQCIFIGTTNNDEFLKDETGNRRYWPVSVSSYDFESLKGVRDQLLAEALVEYDLGEPLYLEDAKAAIVAEREQAKRMEHDPLTDLIRAKFAAIDAQAEEERAFNTEQFTMHELIHDMGPLANEIRDNQAEHKRIGRALRMLGYKKKVARVGKVLHKVWYLEGGGAPPEA